MVLSASDIVDLADGVTATFTTDKGGAYDPTTGHRATGTATTVTVPAALWGETATGQAQTQATTNACQIAVHASAVTPYEGQQVVVGGQTYAIAGFQTARDGTAKAVYLIDLEAST